MSVLILALPRWRGGKPEIPDELTTKPTIETVVARISALDRKFDERISALDRKVDERINALEKRMDEGFERVNERFDSTNNEIDRVANVAHGTKAEMPTLRVDFRELRAQLKEVLPITQPT